MKKIISKLMVLLFGIVLFASCSGPDGSMDESAEKKAVWEAVEKRFNTWQSNDFEGHMAVYHPDWRRWEPNSWKLMKKEDFRAFWDRAKNDEQVIDMELEPVEIVFYCDGQMAIAHFISTESFLETGGAKTDEEGNPIERGSVQTVTMRWSDVMVKEGGKWLYVGGHRDFGSLKEEDKEETKEIQNLPEDRGDIKLPVQRPKGDSVRQRK